jgi:signal transduction histidine kinase
MQSDFSNFNPGPALTSQFGAYLAMPTKPTVIMIRWPVIIICSYLLLDPKTPFVPVLLVSALIFLYVASNIALYCVDEGRFESSRFYTPLVVGDTAILTLALVINGHVETDFYLAYFLLVIICCIFENPKILITVSLLAPLVYMLLLFRSVESVHPSVYLRLPFLFIVALFCGYFAQRVRAEKRLVEEVVQRNKGRKEALDLISHEFRTPLNLISGYAQALKGRLFGEINGEQEDAVSKILRQSDHLLYMVNGILDLARVEAGVRTLQWEEVALSDYLEQLRHNYDLPQQKPIAFEWSIARGLPTIRTDKMKLTIVLQNLINNAIKYTEQGTVKVSVRSSTEGEGVLFQVADTGVGIPKESISGIFGKFTQIAGSAERPYGGVGLGLHIVKVFTELLGGTVKVESELNRGSTFTLFLPCDGAP